MGRMRRILAGVIAAAGLCLVMAERPAHAQTNIVVNCFWPPQYFICQKILPEWIEEVNKVTGGRVKGTLLAMSASSPQEQTASVEKGVVDVAIQFVGLIQNRVIGPSITLTPFTATDDSIAMSKALWETSQKYFPNEFKTVHLLSLFVFPPSELYSQTDTPVNSMSDLKSRKVWTFPGTIAEVTKKIGSGVVATPAVKSHELISRGVVDAHFGLSHYDVQSFQVGRYTKSTTKFRNPILAASFAFIINKDKWNSISKADQKAIMEVSGEKFGRSIATENNKLTQKALDALKADGLKIVDADPAFEKELIEASSFMTDRWMEQANKAGIDAKAAYQYYVARIKELSNK